MKDIELIKLIKRHTKAQSKANILLSDIFDEFNKRGQLNEDNVISCLHNTEPVCWESELIRIIEGRKYK